MRRRSIGKGAARAQPPLARALRALLLVGTSTLVVCGVKGPPHPPAQAQPDAGAHAAADAGAP